MQLDNQFMTGSLITFQDIHNAIWPVCNVKHYGAVGDGVTDDREALQALVDKLFVNGGGIIYFPPGAYNVTLNPAAVDYPYALLMRGANIHWLGHRKEDSIIRLADGQPGYDHLIWHDYQYPAHNLIIENLTFDHNIGNNPIPSIADLSEFPRRTIGIWTGDHITIRNCRFTNFESKNNIMLSGTMADLNVIDCLFDNINGSVTEYHDYSAIYLKVRNGKRGIRIIGNRFDAGGERRMGATTAIETHGHDQIVRDNSVRNLRIGAIITGERTTGTEMVTVADNHFYGCQYGISVWSMHDSDLGFIEGPGMQGVRLSGNHIVLDMDQWVGMGGSCGRAIHAYWDNDAPIYDWMIDHNVIRFLPVTSPDVVQWKCNAVAAIYSTLSPYKDRNWVITHNIFRNVPGSAINITPTVTNLITEDNLVD